jgi:hypothetical protein
MSMLIPDCPVCPPGTCKGYPHLWQRMRENPLAYRKIHDSINGSSLDYPSLLQQAANVAGAVGSIVASAVHGEPISVPQEEQDRRLAICHGCEFWDAQQGRCSKCGCFGAWKSWLTSQQCPVGKW